jgi:hypothetical protein
LTGASRVDVSLADLEGKALTRFEDVPFDAEQGEVFIACQRRFAETFPHEKASFTSRTSEAKSARRQAGIRSFIACDGRDGGMEGVGSPGRTRTYSLRINSPGRGLRIKPLKTRRID